MTSRLLPLPNRASALSAISNLIHSKFHFLSEFGQGSLKRISTFFVETCPYHESSLQNKTFDSTCTNYFSPWSSSVATIMIEQLTEHVIWRRGGKKTHRRASRLFLTPSPFKTTKKGAKTSLHVLHTKMRDMSKKVRPELELLTLLHSIISR